MTQKEIEKFLANTKVYVAGKSKEIQEKIFSFGFHWKESSYYVININKPFLYLSKNKEITYGDDMKCFTEHEYREVSVKEILKLELTGPTYRPFKDAEECWQEMMKHQPFGWIKGSPKYHLVSSVNDVYIWLSDKVYYTFEEALNYYTFADDTPFGIEKE